MFDGSEFISRMAQVIENYWADLTLSGFDLNVFGSITGKTALCRNVPLKVENIIPLMVETETEFKRSIILEGKLI